MAKIIRRPDRAEGGITPEEKARMDDHAKLWIERAMRTAPIEPEKIIPAIEGLYAAAGLTRPRVVIVPSPLVMAFAYGASPPPETEAMLPPPETEAMLPPPETAAMLPPPGTEAMLPPPGKMASLSQSARSERRKLVRMAGSSWLITTPAARGHIRSLALSGSRSGRKVLKLGSPIA